MTNATFTPAQMATVITVEMVVEMVQNCIVNGAFSTVELEKLVAYGQQVLHERAANDTNEWVEGSDDIIELGDMLEDAHWDAMAEQDAMRNTINAGFTIG